MPAPQLSRPQRHFRIGLALFVAISALLLVAYYALLARDYSVLFENLRESDTSAVTAELDKQGIAYRLADDGHSILVDKGDVASARVAVAAANVLAGGDVGFELFNDSDIGLSEFSQKMNYLRALQGELTRTIMAMDGIRFTRVHLALPERSIFRNDQARPSAAITVQTIDGRPLAPTRVRGLQQLVAAAVTDLDPDEVVILDADGMALSAPAPAETSGLTERSAYEGYAQLAARNAIAALMGTRAYEVTASARSPEGEQAPAPTADAVGEAPATVRARPRLQIVVRTRDELDAGTQAMVRERIAEQLTLDPGAGDDVVFRTGVVRAPLSPASYATPAEPISSHTTPDASMTRGSQFSLDWLANRWIWFLLGLIALVVWLVWRQRGSLSDDERTHFAAVLAEEIDAHRSRRRG